MSTLSYCNRNILIRNLSCMLVDSLECWTFFFLSCVFGSDSENQIRKRLRFSIEFSFRWSSFLMFVGNVNCENLEIMRFAISLWRRQCSSLNRIFRPRLVLWQTKSIICEIFSKISIKMRRWKCLISMRIANLFVSFTTCDEWLREESRNWKSWTGNLHTQVGWGWMEILSTRSLNYRQSCNRRRKISCCHYCSVSEGW